MEKEKEISRNSFIVELLSPGSWFNFYHFFFFEKKIHYVTGNFITEVILIYRCSIICQARKKSISG